ncbi:MAG: hypothetical protein R3C02_15005 [Planctomycetaceae bacterium]
MRSSRTQRVNTRRGITLVEVTVSTLLVGLLIVASLRLRSVQSRGRGRSPPMTREGSPRPTVAA